MRRAHYLAAAPEPLASIATVLADTGLRPEECFRLRREDLTWVNGRHGALLVTRGKTAKCARPGSSSCFLCSFRHRMEMTALSRIKPMVWIRTTKADLTSFPEDVKDAMGYALYIAQGGGRHVDAKPMRGFSGAGILEIVEDHAGDTYRAVYTVRLAGRIYVLHVFQKKSKTGIIESRII